MTHTDTAFPSAVRWMTVTVLTMFVLAGVAGAADEEERVILHAETQLGTADGWHGEGDVRIVYQDIEIRCDEAEWNRASRAWRAEESS